LIKNDEDAIIDSIFLFLNNDNSFHYHIK